MSAAAKPRPRPLVTGSLAYDFVMTFAGRFVDHIERGRRRGVSVAFESPTMRRHFGGCAGNIAYGLKMLGDEPRIVATVGEDFAPYRARLRELQIEDGGIKTVADSLTAQAYILTDNENSQLIFFHPGAMHFSHIQAAAGEGDYALAVVAPDGRQGMLRHARDLAARRIPFVFDPGQATPTFAGEELIECLNLAQIAIFNRHEFEMFSKATGVGVAQAASRLRALVVTDGEIGFDDLRARRRAQNRGRGFRPHGRSDRLRRRVSGGLVPRDFARLGLADGGAARRGRGRAERARRRLAGLRADDRFGARKIPRKVRRRPARRLILVAAKTAPSIRSRLRRARSRSKTKRRF